MEKTKLELEKSEEVSGKVYFNIRVNGNCELTYGKEEEAKEAFEICLNRIKEGYPKKRILQTKIIQ